jgi:hypothetical protein
LCIVIPGCISLSLPAGSIPPFPGSVKFAFFKLHDYPEPGRGTVWCCSGEFTSPNGGVKPPLRHSPEPAFLVNFGAGLYNGKVVLLSRK